MNRKLYGKVIFDLSKPGRRGYCLAESGCEDALADIPAALLRSAPPRLPEVDEPTVVRHYTNMSTNNFVSTPDSILSGHVR